MMRQLSVLSGLACVLALVPACAGPEKIDVAAFEPSPRPSALDAYDAFVGKWNWEAAMAKAEAPYDKWTGTAEWAWALDKRCLEGHMVAQSGDKSFEARGIWSVDPVSKKHLWWMFNNWGHPQQGTATYDADTNSWTMPYTSVGLDGTRSHGVYRMTVKEGGLLDWQMDEWADALHMIKKVSMKGTYRRAE